MQMMTKAVKGLLIVNIAAYIINVLVGMVWGLNLNALFGLFYVESPYFLPFQFLTHMFMHGDIWHIFFNMFALWMFGRIMEQTWGWKKFLVFYFVCGFGAALLQEAGQFIGLISPQDYIIGASGAVMGVMLAFGMTYPNEKIFIIPIPIPIKAIWLIIGYAVYEVILGLLNVDKTAHFAHLGGMLFGFLLILYWKFKAKKRTNSSYIGWRTTSTHPNMKVHYNKNERSRDYEFNAQKKEQNDEIDRILDKIRQDGYASLSEKEKKQLFDASNQ
ncbi:MAG: rhomboid family intramembrane serine protease [Bacteroidaceae bacterium]|nr:rhomboid family intramembrane serine protease [Bacteroidaceae bacterium]